MIVKKSQYAKEEYLYYRLHCSEIYLFNFSTPERVLIGSHRNKNKYYIKAIHASFDIETTRITGTDNSTMYIWSLGLYFNNIKHVIYGNYWDEFINTINFISDRLDENEKILVWVANLGYEWQFMKKHLNVTNSFFRTKREPFYIEHNNNIIFQEALNYFGNSLKSLAKNKCNTQKAVGDLDYSIQRFNFNCNLTEKEEGYTDNDVLILIEWGKYYYDTYLKNHYRPISIQSIIRHKLKKDMFNEFTATQIMNIRTAYPDKPLYTKIMEYLYRGGYVHANVRYVMELLKNIPSRDITSAYPYYMLVGYVPFKFKKENPLKFNEIKNNKSKCWFAKFKFKNVKSSTWHSIESVSKCIEITKHINDNGRVMSAGEMVVYLNELDFEIYEKFYTWDTIECLELYSADKIKLPKYVIKNLFDAYVKKSILKKAGKPYADEKTIVNSFYGVMVTKFNEYDLQYNSDTDTFTEVVADFEKVRKRAILLPQWGVWITSGIRNYLLNTAYKIIKAGGDCDYFDTDSIKFNDIAYDYIFIENNKQVNKKVKYWCDYYKLDFNIISGLGEFDFEGLYPTFKTLGCKRYIYIDEKGHFKQTIAGLPKDTLVTFARETRDARHKVDLFKYFDNQMTFDQTIKLTSIYNDTGFSMDIDGHKIEELSCLTLDNTPFTLKLKDVYLDLMNNLYSDRQEKRILG